MAKPKTRKRRKILIFSIVGLLVAGVLAAAFLRKREPVLPVQVEKVTRRNLTEKVVANGRIQPVLQVKISAEVSGEIIELPVKEGMQVKKGDLLVRIKPDTYQAARRNVEASYQSSLSGLALSEANLRQAEQELQRNEQLYKSQLISETIFLEYKTALEIAQAQVESSKHQTDMAKASLARADEDLAKTTIYSPINGTISKLNSELGERVVGTAMMSGTEIMIVADLDQMEARVDIGEIDIVLIALAQKASLEVDAFRDRKFTGAVTEIANSSKTAAMSGSSQDATKFEVRIRIQDKEAFRPGMSVTAEVETRYRTNVLTVPVQSVTTRPPKKPEPAKGTNQPAATGTNAAVASGTNATTNAAATGTNAVAKDRKAGETPKPIEVVFRYKGDTVEMVPVKRGISDDSHTEILEGLEEGQEIVSGGYKAIAKDLQDGKKVRIGEPDKSIDKDKDKAKS